MVSASPKVVTLTYVQYRNGDQLDHFLAWISLVLVFINFGGFFCHFFFCRELQGMWPSSHSQYIGSSSQPHHYLAGNFAQVADETPPITNLSVIVHLPECLDEEFVRVGPNPRFAPVAGYHWFDGDS
ncbi:hypothetical protein FF2_009627 [Malus domestica]